jgi:hypothetical protein
VKRSDVIGQNTNKWKKVQNWVACVNAAYCSLLCDLFDCLTSAAF